MMVEEDKQRIGKEGPVNKSNGWVNLETSVYWCWTWNQIPGWKFSTSDSLKSKLCNARRASKQDNKTGYTEGKRFPTWDETLKTTPVTCNWQDSHQQREAFYSWRVILSLYTSSKPIVFQLNSLAI